MPRNPAKYKRTPEWLERVRRQARHYCRNTHCRSKLKAPVENEHHAFCTPGCHARILPEPRVLCVKTRRAASAKISASKSGTIPARRNISVFRGLAESDLTPLETLDSSGSKVDPCAVLPRKCSGARKGARLVLGTRPGRVPTAKFPFSLARA